MQQRAAAAFLVLLGIGAACSSPRPHEARPGRDAQLPYAVEASLEIGAPGGVLVLLRADVPPTRYLDVARAAGATVLYRYRAIPALYVVDAGGNAAALAARLAKLPEVASATADRRRAPPRARPTAGAPAPGAAPPRARGAGIAILGSGVSPQAQLRLGAICFSTFTTGGCDDPSGHGTTLARIATGSGDGGASVVYPVRVFDDELATSDAVLLAGLDWVAANAQTVTPPIRIAVTPSSLGEKSSPAFQAIARALAAAGVSLEVSPGAGHLTQR